MNLEHAYKAAARAWHDEIERSVVEPGDELVLWDYEDEDVKEHYLTTARANVNAAAPLIAAQALRDAAWQAELDSPDDGVSPYWLRTRANDLETK